MTEAKAINFISALAIVAMVIGAPGITGKEPINWAAMPKRGPRADKVTAREGSWKRRKGRA